jgi:hypothetical protein
VDDVTPTLTLSIHAFHQNNSDELYNTNDMTCYLLLDTAAVVAIDNAVKVRCMGYYRFSSKLSLKALIYRSLNAYQTLQR